MNHKETVAVAMSGGVDSSVAAALIQEQGHDLFGLTMVLWDFDAVGGNIHNETTCCSIESIEDARTVCHRLNIPHYVVNLRDVFDQQIIQNFVNEYLVGRTPNPCVLCNSLIKWGALLEQAQKIGATKLATGHYARSEFNPDTARFMLLKGLDAHKEQSYALWGLTQFQLQHTLFPLGHLTKSEVRHKAAALGLKTAQKSESQEICFIPDNDYERFLKDRLPGLSEKLQKGEVIDENGKVLGYHRGYPFYTIGQRKGLLVAAGHRIYVTHIDPENNKVYVGKKEKIFSHGLKANQINWVSMDGNFPSLEVTAKIRYKDPGFEAILRPMNGNQFILDFLNPQKSVTPGQSVVCYQGENLICGGIIFDSIEPKENIQ
ncbi:tRNA 2-thiouridine(34) synthase MnmA [candidate division KSB1 bacterium]|nr:tRNA 2-thiouridine(34) synthase MnmA [candidate division KSB1 bacterium]